VRDIDLPSSCKYLHRPYHVMTIQKYFGKIVFDIMVVETERSSGTLLGYVQFADGQVCP
jgi:hypothetical protein